MKEFKNRRTDTANMIGLVFERKENIVGKPGKAEINHLQYSLCGKGVKDSGLQFQSLY